MKIFRAVKRNGINQHFGANLNPLYAQLGYKGHNGIDWSAQDGEEVRWDTNCNGQVIETSIDSYGGFGVVISSCDCIKGEFFKHRFWHLKEFKCKTGQILNSGDIIGLADNTGWSTGSHLHRDLKPCDNQFQTLEPNNGYGGCVDPLPYMQNIYIKDYVDSLNAHISILSKMIEAIKKMIDSFKNPLQPG